MDQHDARSVWEALKGLYGEALRAVIQYDGFDYDAVSRPDVTERYRGDDEVLKLVNDVVVNQLMLNDSAEFFRAGRYRAFVRVFDDAWVLTRPDDEVSKAGFIVSLERGEGGSDVEVGQCVEQVDALLAGDGESELHDNPPMG